MISEGLTIVFELAMGIITDTFGRKVPIVVSFFMMGVAMASIPLFTKVYPWFLICRSLINFGVVIGGNIPLLPDYVSTESMGLASSYL